MSKETGEFGKFDFAGLLRENQRCRDENARVLPRSEEGFRRFAEAVVVAEQAPVPFGTEVTRAERLQRVSDKDAFTDGNNGFLRRNLKRLVETVEQLVHDDG